MGFKPHFCILYEMLSEDDSTNIIIELKLFFVFHSLFHEERVPVLILKEFAPRICLDKDFLDFAAQSYMALFFIFEVSCY